MSLRFICPYCRVSVDPAAMELSQSDRAEMRVCPYCDTPVLLGARGEPDAQHPDTGGGSLPSGFEAANCGAEQCDSSKAAA